MSPEGIAIVTDSTSDIPARLVTEHGIHVVPLAVTIDGVTYEDGVFTQAEFFDRMNAAKRLPTTSQPPVGAFVEAYSRALRAATHVVSVHISSLLSGTVESARQAAEQFGDRVTVFDSANLSMGLGLQVLEAAKAARAGAGVTEVVRALESARDRTRLIVGLDSLDNLARGGRIGKVAKFLGGVLDLRVVFHVKDGAFQPLARTRGSKAALRATLDWVGEQVAGRGKAAFCVLHALSEDRAEWLRQQIEERYESTETFIAETGSVITAHTGTGWGVALITEE